MRHERLDPTDDTSATEVSDVLARAFQNDEFFVRAYGNPSNRTRALRVLFRGLVRLHLPLNACFAAYDGDQIVGASFWAPCSFHAGFLDSIRAGMGGLFRYPISLLRLMRCDDLYIGEMQRRATPEAHYLNSIGVLPEHQGRGIGSAMLRHQLEALVDPTGLDAWLWTNNDLNERLYGRFGFEVVHRESIPPPRPFTARLMHRALAR
ncbi:MAG: GNAT family N-acetyltransferase [Myxococcota bacterium]